MFDLDNVFKQIAKDSLRTWIRAELMSQKSEFTESIEDMAETLEEKGFSTEEQIEMITEYKEILSDPFDEVIRKLKEDE